MTDDSAFKKRVRARMAETGEKYTVARRVIIAGRDPGPPPAVVRVYLNPHVDFELTAGEAQAYAAADEQGRLELADRLLAEWIDAVGLADARVTADSKLVTDEQPRAETEATEDAAIRDAVQRSIERAVGLSAVEVDLAPDRVHVTIRAARPDLAWGFVRAPADEGVWRELAADRLRHELEELTGKRVRLNILQVPGGSTAVRH